MGVKLTELNSTVRIDAKIGLRGEFIFPKNFDPTKIVGEGVNGRTANDLFGTSVSIDGDYCVVGVPGQSTSSTGGATVTAAGAVYIFTRNNAGWELETKLTAEQFANGRQVSANFGFSVDISGKTIVVGAPNDSRDNTTSNDASEALVTNAGSVYVFSKVGGSKVWNMDARLVASDRASGNKFGHSVTLYNDVIVVGAPYTDSDSNNKISVTDGGATYVFAKSGNPATWTQIQKLTGFYDSRVQNDKLGYAVAYDEGVLVVSSPYQDYIEGGQDYVQDSGAIYSFAWNGTSWVYETKITLPVRAANQLMGTTLAFANSHLVVGVQSEGYGCLYFYERTLSGKWDYKQKVAATAADSQYGFLLSMFNDKLAVGTKKHIFTPPTSYDTDSFSSSVKFKPAYDADFTDTISNATITTLGTPVISTTEKVYGAGSLYLDGSSGVSYADPAGSGTNIDMFEFAASEPFTIECWVKTTSTNQYMTIMDKYSAQGGGYVLQLNQGTPQFISYTSQGNLVNAASIAVNDGSWHHIAVSRNAANLMAIFVDGIPYDSKTISPVINASTTLNIGYRKDTATEKYTGYVDGIRITKGVARYTVAAGVDIYNHNGTSWVLSQKIAGIDFETIVTPDVGSLSLYDDLLLIGDPNHTYDQSNQNSLTNAGAAWLMTYNDTTSKYELTQKFAGWGHDRNTGDNLGSSVAYDNGTLVVGAINHDYDADGYNYTPNAGAVYVWDWNGTNYTFKQKITPTGTNARVTNDNFGYKVAIDGGRIAVGVPYHDYDSTGANLISNAGAIWTFVYQNGKWVQEAKLTPSGTNARVANDSFGSNFYLSGSTLLVGVTSHSYDEVGANSISGSGAVWAFTNDGTNWSQTQKIVAPYRPAGEASYFGSTVSFKDNWMVVGAPQHAYDLDNVDPQTNAGAAYIYKKNTTTGLWEFFQKVSGEGRDRNAEDQYGYVVVGDNGTLVVSAPQHDYDGNGRNYVQNAGAVYVWTWSGSQWNFQQKVTPLQRRKDVKFGINIAIDTDTLAVLANDSQYEKVYLDFEGANGATSTTDFYNTTITFNGAVISTAKAKYGTSSVYLSGTSTVSIPAFNFSTSDLTIEFNVNLQSLNATVSQLTYQNGNFFIWYDNTAKAIKVQLVGMPNNQVLTYPWVPTMNTWYNIALCRKDSILTLYIDGVAVGSVNGGYSLTTVSSPLLIGDGAGATMYVDDFVVINGESKYSSNYTPTKHSPARRKVWIFKRQFGIWSEDGAVTLPNTTNNIQTNDQFGKNIAIHNDVVVVSAHQHSYDDQGVLGATGMGAVHVFEKSNGSWIYRQKLVSPKAYGGQTANGYFGSSVDVRNGIIVVGEPWNNTDREGMNSLSQAGAAWVFTKNTETQKYDFLQKVIGESNNRQPNELTGYSVSASNGVLAVGSPGHCYDPSGSKFVAKSGAVFMWSWDAGNQKWQFDKKLVPSDRWEYDNFGTNVALEGNTLVVSKVSTTTQTADTLLLLDFEGADNSTTITDTAKNMKVVTGGNAAIKSTRYKYGSSSLYLDGNSFVATSSTPHSYGNIRTIELNFATGQTTGTQVLIGTWGGSLPDNSYRLTVQNNVLNFEYRNGNSTSTWSGTTRVTDNLWHHVAVCKYPSYGSFYYIIYLDGKIEYWSTLITSAFNWGYNITTPLAIGGTPNGFMPTVSSNDLYSSSILLNMDFENDLTDSVSNTTFTNNGVTFDNTNKKTGSYSAYFNGTGAYLSSTPGNVTKFAGDFTVEGWFRPSSYSVPLRYILDTRSNGTSTGGFALVWVAASDGSYLRFITGNTLTTSSITLSTETWQHWAIVRSNGVISVYVDGIRHITLNNTANMSDGQLLIGKNVGGTGGYYWGNIDKLTITNGAARYINEFSTSMTTNGFNGYIDNVALHSNWAKYTDAFSPQKALTAICTNCVYVFTKSGVNWTESAKIVPTDKVIGDMFGTSLSLNNGSLAIGSYLHNLDANGLNTLANTGAVYVYTGSGSTWTLQQKISAPAGNNRAVDDNFGYSVALRGDVLVIGTPGQDYDDSGSASNSITSNAGAAYVYTRTGSTWAFTQKLIADKLDRQGNDNFGWSVAAHNGRLVVGARYHDYDVDSFNYVSNAGAAYIFDWNGSNGWTYIQKIVPTGTNARNAEDKFGYVVDIHNDTLVVSSPYHTYDATGANSVSNAGAVFVFERNTTTNVWSQTAKLVASGTNARKADDNFGLSAAIDSGTIVVGSPFHDYDADGANAVTNAGAVWVFEKVGGNWTSVKKIVPTGTNSRAVDDQFGTSVAISDTVMIVGAPGQDWDRDGRNSKTDAGAAWTFVKDNGVWTQQQKIIAWGDARTDVDNFGWAVSGDGIYLAVGTPGHVYDGTMESSGRNAERNYTLNAGAVFIWKWNGTSWNIEQRVAPSGVNSRNAGDRFGEVLVMKGTQLAVASKVHGYDVNGANFLPNAGAVWVFERTGSGLYPWVQTAKLIPTGTNARLANDEFGSTLSIIQDRIAVGVPRHPYDATGANGIPNAGAVWIFDKSNGTWTQTKKIVNRSGIPTGLHPVADGLVAWWDASDLTTILMNSSTWVTKWNCRNTSNIYAVSSGTSSVDFKLPGAPTGVPAMRFYSNSNLRIVDLEQNSYNQLTVFIAHNMTAGTSPLTLGDNLTNNYQRMYLEARNANSGNSVNNLDVSFGGQNDARATLTDIASYSRGWCCWSATVAGTAHTAQVYDNSIPATMTTTGTNGAISIKIGPTTSTSSIALIGSADYQGYIGEILIYNRVLSPTEREQVEAYLMNKWLTFSWVTPPTLPNVRPGG